MAADGSCQFFYLFYPALSFLSYLCKIKTHIKYARNKAKQNSKTITEGVEHHIPATDKNDAWCNGIGNKSESVT
jgi:hypothetical protein